MDSDEVGGIIFNIFKDFMARVAKLEQLGDTGSSLLAGFWQALGLLHRPPLILTSKLVDDIIKANETKRLSSYIAAGCINNHDMKCIHACLNFKTIYVKLFHVMDITNNELDVDTLTQKPRKLSIPTSQTKESPATAKTTLNELESLMEDVSNVMQTKDTSLALPSGGKHSSDELDQTSTACQDEAQFSNNRHVEMTDYGILMAIIYSMLKQNHVMQERIVTSLDLKKFSGEAESYSLVWDLRPLVNDDIMHRAWMLIP